MTPRLEDAGPQPMTPPRIVIGVFAHNEERNIGRTLRDLAAQSVFAANAPVRAELVVLANGCRDNTCAAARAAIEEQLPALSGAGRARVADIEQGGKSRTWNHFVHTLLPASAGYVIFTDADIEFPDRTTLADLVAYLEAHPKVQVATSQAIKSTELQGTWNPVEWLSARASKLSRSRATHAIAGSLYCMRASLARRIVLPTGLLVEDGFVRIAVSTDAFCAEPDDERIQRVPGARHVFHPCRGVLRNLRHERRLVIGTLQNFAVWEWIRGQDRSHCPAELIREMNEQDKAWTTPLLQSHALTVGYRGVTKLAWRRAAKALMTKTGLRRALAAPIAAARLLFSGLAGMSAIHAIQRSDIRW